MHKPSPTDAPAASAAAGARGFTLIEMLTTVAVLVVSLALAAPALGGFIRSNRLVSAQSEYVSSLMLARSEAARRGTPVGIDAKAAAAAGGFARGWRVWVDANGNGNYDAGETLLRDVADRGAGVAISATGDVRDVVFSPRGFLAAAALVDVIVCGSAGEVRGYRLRVEPVGLVDAAEVTTCP